MVILAACRPVLRDGGEIQVKALHRAGALGDGRPGPRPHTDRGKARGSAQALLGGPIAQIQIPRIHRQFDPAERGHGIDNEQGVIVMDDLGNLGNRTENARGGLRMDDPDRLDLPLAR